MSGMETEGLRLDKWLWHARFVRRRELVTDLVSARRVRVNGLVVAKTHHTVRPGDILTVTEAERIRVVRVKDLGLRRGTANDAAVLYDVVTSDG